MTAGEMLGTSPQMRAFGAKFRTPNFLEFVTFVTGMPDPDVVKSGFYSSAAGEKIILDRRMDGAVGLVSFLNEEWNDDWRGHFELWSAVGVAPWREEKLIRPLLNRIVIFDASGWHGFPAPLECPEYVKRQWFEAFYLPRSKAKITDEPIVDSAGDVAAPHSAEVLRRES